MVRGFKYFNIIFLGRFDKDDSTEGKEEGWLNTYLCNFLQQLLREGAEKTPGKIQALKNRT